MGSAPGQDAKIGYAIWYGEKNQNFFWDFPGHLMVKNLPCNAGDVGSIPGQGTKNPRAPTREPVYRKLQSPRDATKTQYS